MRRADRRADGASRGRALAGVAASLAATALLGGASSAQASSVTLGSPMTASNFSSVPFGGAGSNMASQTILPGATTVAPFDGTIVSWSVMGASGGPLSLRIVKPSGAQFVGGGSAVSGPLTSLGKLTFTASLPIKTGQLIGIQSTAPTDTISITSGTPGANYNYFSPTLANGGAPTSPTNTQVREIALNATVLSDCTAPSVKGKKEGAAKNALVAAGCDTIVVNRPKGKKARKKAKFVKSQSPAAGSVVAGGSPVTLTLGKKKKKKK